MGLTVQDLLGYIPDGTTYMICPFNRRTMDLLKSHVVDLHEDKELLDISDRFENTKEGKNFLPLKVNHFGIIHVDDAMDYEPDKKTYSLRYNASYLLILVDV